MTVSRDPDRLIHAFLREGEDELQDQVYDAVRAAIEQKRQRAFLGPRRLPEMNKIVTIGLGAAAVVVALVVGAQLIGSPSGGTDGPRDEPTATPEPTVTPEPTATPEPRGLPEGPHLLVERPATGASITVSIAAPDWSGYQGESFIEWGPTGANGPTGAGMIGFPDGEYYVYGDPCAWSSTTPDSPATTVDGLMAALASQASREASVPEDITVDGYSGKKIILDMSYEAADFDACDEVEGEGTFGLFTVAHDGSPWRASWDVGQIEEVWAVDVDGVVVVNIGLYYEDTPQHAIDEVRAMLESATFDVP